MAKKKVYIDPGHGGVDPGAIGVNGTEEKDITLSVAKKIKDLLEEQGIEVRMSRTTDKTLSLGQRTTDANKYNADAFVSVHCNAFNGVAQGVETFSYTQSTSDLAKDIQNEVLKSGAYTKNRGTKTAGFYVIRNTSMRAALIELAFIDNKEDNKILLNKQDEIAEAVARGICKHLGIKYSEPPTEEKPSGPVEDTDTFYRVVCGSYSSRVLAEEQMEELKEKGFDSFIAIYEKDE